MADARARTAQALDRERARRDAHWFLFESGYVWTKDEHDPVDPVKRLPDIPYLRALLDCLLVSGHCIPPEDARYALEAGVSLTWLIHAGRTGVLLAEKSRQVIVTWLVSAYCWWRARSRAHQLILIQSKREDDAANLVFVKEPHVARISFMEDHLPQALRMTTWPKSGTYGHLYFSNGSHIWGIPEGGEIIRSNTPSVVFADEAGFQPAFGASYTAALPAIHGGGQYVAVSSAEPSEFATLLEGEAMSPTRAG